MHVVRTTIHSVQECVPSLCSCRCLKAKSDGVRRLGIREIELQPRANGIDYKDLVARVLDVLFLKVDSVSDETRSQFGRARTFECDVIDTTVVAAAFLDRAFGEMRVDMN